jgi:hypothetical protein
MYRFINSRERTQRLNNSIVARIDLLKNIKQLVLGSLGLKIDTSVLGTYVGDVEQFQYSSMSDTVKEKLISSFQKIDSAVTELETSNLLGGRQFIVDTFDALTNGLPTSTYSFIKIYSGAVSGKTINSMLKDINFVSNAIVVKIKSPKDLIIPISIDDKTFASFQKEAFVAIEVNKIEDVFTSNVFKLLFELNNESEKKPEVVKQPSPDMQQEDDGLDDEIEEGPAMNMAA